MSTLPQFTILRSWALRPADEGDFASLYENCWKSHDNAHHTFELALQRQRSGNAVTVVAATTTDNMRVAFAQLSRWRSGAEISDLIVMETWRRQGIGGQIIRHLIDIARQKPLRYVEIGVEKNNTAALRLYKSCGFAEVTLDTALQSAWMEPTILYLRISLRA